MQSVNRALDVLFHLAGEREPSPAAAIAEDVGLPRPTVYRILETFVERKIVNKVGRRFAIADDEIRRLIRC